MTATAASDGRFRALLAGFATPDLRRVQSASGLSAVGEWGFMVILSIYAFDQGGATAVGLVGGSRLVLAAIAAPLASGFADSHSRRAVMIRCLLLRSLSLAVLAAVVAASGPLAAVLVLAGVFSIVSTVYRPATAALLPLISSTPQQLAAANAMGSALANGGFLVGALAGGVVSAVASSEVAFALAASTFLFAALASRRLPHDEPPASAPGEADVVRETTAGIRALLDSHESRVVVALFGAATVVEGATDVLLVVLALDLLDLGQAGVGWLNAAWGVGGLVGGAVAAAALVGGRLAPGLSGGCVLVGCMLAGLGVWTAAGAAVVMLGVLGVGYAFVEVAETTLLQRLLPDEILGRAFGAVESVYLGATGIGALLAPVVIAALGARGAFVALGLGLTTLALIAWPMLARFAAATPVGAREFGLVRGVPFLGVLPLATLETLTRQAVRVPVEADDVVIRQGDHGDRFYVIDTGEVRIDQDDEPLRTDGPGGFFGEIALVRDVPRTATVVATEPGELLALDRDSFLAAVTGQDRSNEAARAVASERLGGDLLAADEA